MNNKNFKTLMSLLKLDDSSRESFEMLVKSKCPNDFILRLVTAKKYWLRIRVETLEPFDSGTISVLLRTNNMKKLDKAMNSGLADKRIYNRCADLVKDYHKERLHMDFIQDLMDSKNYRQHTFTWMLAPTKQSVLPKLKKSWPPRI